MTQEHTQQTALVVTGEGTKLQVMDPNVQSLAKHLGWRPDTVIARIERHLPARIQQDMYLLTVRDWIPILPETFARVLEYVSPYQRVTQELLERDEKKVIAIGDNIALLLSLLAWGKEEDSTIIDVESAARLAAMYGDYAEDILDLVEDTLDRIRDQIGLGKLPRPQAFAIVVKAIANNSGGGPNVLKSDDIIALFQHDFSQDPNEGGCEE